MQKTAPARALAEPCLEVSCSPTGRTHAPNHVRLRFSKPMIRLGQSDLPAVQIEPAVQGDWRWHDQQTLIFEPSSPLAHATRYRVTLRAGTRSLDGSLLKGDQSWEFLLEGPILLGLSPETDQPLGLKPTFRACFNQAVDPASLLGRVILRAGRRRLALECLSRDLEQELVFAPRVPLPGNARIVLELPAGLPSAEGPEKSLESHRRVYRTYGPLKALGRGLVDWLTRPDPFGPLSIRFSNPLQPDTARVRVEPPWPDLVVSVHAQELHLDGTRPPGQPCSVVVEAVTDVFGQVLQQPVRRTFRGSWTPFHLSLPSGMMIVLRPGEKVPFYCSGYRQVDCRLLEVEPESWEAHRQGKFVRSKLLRSWTQKVPNRGQLETVWLDVGPELGHRLLEVRVGRNREVVWLQRTGLNLQVRSHDEGLSLVAAGVDGQPVEGVSVAWGEEQGRTGSDGHCRLGRPQDALSVLARRGDDCTVLPLGPALSLASPVRWCVFDDRGLYRPGDTARVKGWVRPLTAGPVDYTLSDKNGTRSGQVALSPEGGFDLELALDARAVLELKLEGSVHHHRFQVTEFRPPEFELELEALPDREHYPADAPPVWRLAARYHSGGNLAGAETSWSHVLSEQPWEPPGWPEFNFRCPLSEPFRDWRCDTVRLDDQGEWLGTIPIPRPRCGQVVEILSTVKVTDQSRQAVLQRATWRVVGDQPMVGLRATAEGAELVVVDPQGRTLAGHAVELSCQDRSWQVLSEVAPIALELAPESTLQARLGEHQVALLIPARTPQLDLRLPAGQAQPGQEVELEVQSPVPYALGVLRVFAGPQEPEVTVFRGQDNKLRVRVPDVGLPLLELHAACLSLTGRWLTVYRQLALSQASRRLTVDLKTDREVVAPGGTARIAVEVRDWRGQPVPGAEVTLLGVDEAVLQAAAYCDPDPLAAIYPPARPAGWELDSSHWFLQDQPPALRRLGTLGGPESVCYCLCSGTGASSPAITLREDLRPLAFFHPALTTDERGRIELEAALPDSITRYRVSAVVARGDAFGSARTSVSTRLPLLVRPWLPRFLHQGDRFDFCLGVQNMTGSELEVAVEATVSGLAFLDGVERRCRVAPGARVRVSFPCRAEGTGQAVGLVRVLSGVLEDACRVRLPLKPPRLKERVTLQGRTGEERALPVEVPPGVELQEGGLELLETDSAAPLARDAFEELRRYPMSCSEQLSSRLLGWVLGGPHFCSGWKAHAEELVQRLWERQHADGQFWLFPGWREPFPFVSAHVTQALLRAYTAGIAVDGERLGRALDFLAGDFPRTPLERAYALNVLSQVGRSSARLVEETARQRRLTAEGAAFLLPLAEGHTRARLRKKVLAGLSEPQEGFFPSQRRATALALMALGEEWLLERVLEPLAYGSTQDYAFTLLALAGQGEGKRSERQVALRELLHEPRVELEGLGFYRATLTTVPSDPLLPALSHGFTVTRRYELGEVVAIHLELELPGSRKMVGLIDPLPAGLELLPPAEQKGVPGAVHCDYRDDCTEVCWSRLPAGKHRLTLLARATTPGTFLAPGTRVEEMYRPQVFGRAAAEVVEL
ncbi:MAG: hypothetical protein AMXMBFR33_71180 [Candidatus Xenobia bacterium]